MNRLEPVELAIAAMNEGMQWSILKWLTEKRRIRRIADTGTAALDEAERAVKARWPDALRDAYAELAPVAEDDDPFAAADMEFARQGASAASEETKQLARRVKEADDAATKARWDAEKGFSDAERRMSASMARSAAEMAINAYELRYRAIAEAEAALAAYTSGAPAKSGE